MNNSTTNNNSTDQSDNQSSAPTDQIYTINTNESRTPQGIIRNAYGDNPELINYLASQGLLDQKYYTRLTAMSPADTTNKAWQAPSLSDIKVSAEVEKAVQDFNNGNLYPPVTEQNPTSADSLEQNSYPQLATDSNDIAQTREVTEYVSSGHRVEYDPNTNNKFIIPVNTPVTTEVFDAQGSMENNGDNMVENAYQQTEESAQNVGSAAAEAMSNMWGGDTSYASSEQAYNYTPPEQTPTYNEGTMYGSADAAEQANYYTPGTMYGSADAAEQSVPTPVEQPYSSPVRTYDGQTVDQWANQAAAYDSTYGQGEPGMPVDPTTYQNPAPAPAAPALTPEEQYHIDWFNSLTDEQRNYYQATGDVNATVSMAAGNPAIADNTESYMGSYGGAGGTDVTYSTNSTDQTYTMDTVRPPDPGEVANLGAL